MEEVSLKRVYDAVSSLFDHNYRLCNSYIFEWESDYFGMSKSGYAYEVEIKMSRSDFRADFKKSKKHKMLKAGDNLVVFKGCEQTEHMTIERATEMGFEISEYEQYRKSCNKPTSTSISIMKPKTPHRFYYACPEGLLTKEEIPDYAGLIYVSEHNSYEVKKAPFLHKQKLKLNPALLDKFYFLSLNLKGQLIEAKRDLLRLQNEYKLIDDDQYEQQKLLI